jgi:hypothetical protein
MLIYQLFSHIVEYIQIRDTAMVPYSIAQIRFGASRAQNLHMEKVACPEPIRSVRINFWAQFTPKIKLGFSILFLVISKPTLFLWHLVQDKKDWQRQDAQARCLDSQDNFDNRYISTLS